ncbi:hypothetical protein [Corynebacterium silvaticum]|uniref:Uncharacterized protein n=1 Tax=Corynebacterium silvaticum TaxID=2320431 RepID=A0A7Y4LI37_9CORY|nr:hypothetical protein [Corynebacterium silvaticum]ARU45562.1 hypothetical protein CBE74_02520 [Corynebacterium silvaticum]MBH5300144.1 hypothetical protein [Corynebacterium silvaticum]NOM65855.1 hypothetical protein [Corynebacterium silvaticum]NON70490.1 hypothetical protein [Corynebacterium silvaticum]TFA91396.1 hypothetical protein EU802_11505 [Corynebacterium silvaticum]
MFDVFIEPTIAVGIIKKFIRELDHQEHKHGKPPELEPEALGKAFAHHGEKISEALRLNLHRGNGMRLQRLHAGAAKALSDMQKLIDADLTHSASLKSSGA